MHAARPILRKNEPSTTRAPGNPVTGRRSPAGSARPPDPDGRSTTSGTVISARTVLCRSAGAHDPRSGLIPGAFSCVVNRTIDDMITSQGRPAPHCPVTAVKGVAKPTCRTTRPGPFLLQHGSPPNPQGKSDQMPGVQCYQPVPTQPGLVTSCTVTRWNGSCPVRQAPRSCL